MRKLLIMVSRPAATCLQLRQGAPLVGSQRARDGLSGRRSRLSDGKVIPKPVENLYRANGAEIGGGVALAKARP